VYLTVTYCPTAFTSMGAVVSVDYSNPKNLQFEIINTFKWPHSFGCVIESDPLFALDKDSERMYFQFNDFDLEIVSLDLNTGEIYDNFKSSDIWFTGYENFYYEPHFFYPALKGLSGTVTQSGFCSDGCYQFGTMEIGGNYKKLQNIPFQAVMDDSNFFDSDKSLYYVQASYDLRVNPCGPDDYSLCLLAIDTTTGNLKAANYTPSWTGYHFHNVKNSDGTVLTWSFSTSSTCNDTYMFGNLDLEKVKMTQISCVDKSVVIDMDEWVTAFSPDKSILATGSGDAYAGVGQLIIFDVKTAKVLVNSQLNGLKKMLNAYSGLFDIFSVSIF